MDEFELSQPTPGQQFQVGQPITIIARLTVSGECYLAAKKLDAMPTVVINNVPGVKIQLTNEESVPTVADSIGTNIYIPTTVGTYRIFAVAKIAKCIVIKHVDVSVV